MSWPGCTVAMEKEQKCIQCEILGSRNLLCDLRIGGGIMTYWIQVMGYKGVGLIQFGSGYIAVANFDQRSAEHGGFIKQAVS